MEDIPSAMTSVMTSVMATVNSTQSTYEKQKSLCLEKIKDMLKESKAKCFLEFKNPIETKLLKELEEKGYIIKFTLSYDKVYNCKLTILNPNIKQNSPEEELTELISSFLNGGNNDNLSKDLLSNLFKFQ